MSSIIYPSGLWKNVKNKSRVQNKGRLRVRLCLRLILVVSPTFLGNVEKILTPLNFSSQNIPQRGIVVDS